MGVTTPIASAQPDVDAFITRWGAAEMAERTNAPFVIERCAVLGVDPPPPARGGEGAYRFERSVRDHHDDGHTVRRIDLNKHGCFIREAKQGANAPHSPRCSRARARRCAARWSAPPSPGPPT